MEDKCLRLALFILSCFQIVLSVSSLEDITNNNTFDSLISTVAAAATTTTTTPPNSTKSEYRVYLVRQTLDKDLNAAILQGVDNESDRKTESKRENNSTTQIYIIAVIGVAPAAIGAFIWWMKNLKRKCVRGKAASKRSKKSNDTNTPNPFLVNDVPIDQITYKIIQRAEKLNDSNALWYNSYKPSYFVKSRRVYSLEVSRKNLDLIEILGEGNFGQV
jgi:hypothetical protein